MGLQVSAGELRHGVTFKRPTTTDSNEGARVKTYATAFVTRAKISRIDQQRALEADAPALVNTDIVIIRETLGREEIRMDWKVAYNGLDHTIQAPIEYIDRFIKLIVKGDTTGAKL